MHPKNLWVVRGNFKTLTARPGDLPLGTPLPPSAFAPHVEDLTAWIVGVE